MDQLLVVPQSSDEIITLKNEADFDRKTAAATKEKLSDMVDSGFQGAVNKFFDAKSNAKLMQSNANNAAANGQILENQSPQLPLSSVAELATEKCQESCVELKRPWPDKPKPLDSKPWADPTIGPVGKTKQLKNLGPPDPAPVRGGGRKQHGSITAAAAAKRSGTSSRKKAGGILKKTTRCAFAGFKLV